MNQLQRVQIYLDPQDITLIREMAERSRISRSQVIRNAIKKHAKTHTQRQGKKIKNALMKMGGIGISKTGTVGLNIDEMYLHD